MHHASHDPPVLSALSSEAEPPREPASLPLPPPRAVWSVRAPAAPWCPDEWHAALEAIAPGLLAATAPAVHEEAMGTAVAHGAWHLVLASRRGRLHAHRGEHREDAGAMGTLDGGWVVAVADGAGSAAWSRLGSAIATHVVTRTFALRVLDGRAPASMLAPALRDAARDAYEALRTFADACQIAPRELRTTLLVVALHAGHVGVLQVGDGAMALRDRDGALVHPHTAATGDFSGEVAHFLPDEGSLPVLLASLQVHAADTVDAVVLATDGVEDPWYPFTRRGAALFDVLQHGCADVATLPDGLQLAHSDSVTDQADPARALAEWLAFEKRGENDDRTLCLVERRPRASATRG